MVSRNFEAAMQAIRNGNMDEGGRLMRIVLKEEMPPNVRAIALIWLAETNADVKFKLDCYRQAQQLDPNNQDVANRLSALLASQLPPTTPTSTAPAPTQPPPASYPGYPQYDNVTTPIASQPPPVMPISATPYVDPLAQPLPSVARGQDIFAGQPPLDIPTLYRTVGIGGGPNGIGTGVFISNKGMIATTRYVVGINTQVDVLLPSGQKIPGFVVRSFPSFDLALVRINAIVRQLSMFSSVPVIMDETPLQIVNYRNEPLHTSKRSTKQQAPLHWFPTLITQLSDAGGDGVFDSRGALLGIMTKNALRTNNYLYGLHLSAIAQCVDLYHHEIQQLQGAETYCSTCGATSRASIYGGFYCETCGATLPKFTGVSRFPQANQNLLTLNNELNVPCKICGARSGFYQNKCLRCGEESVI